MQLQRGQRGKLEGQFNINENIKISMQMNGNAIYDYCCFGVDEDERLSDERYMVFYNQPQSPQSEITYNMNGIGAEFNTVLMKLPNTIHKLIFTVSIDGVGTMGQISQFEVLVSQNGCEPLSLTLSGFDFAGEKALISFEIYNKNGWRYSAVARGFTGGLDDLLRSYGGVLDQNTSNGTSSAQSTIQPAIQVTPTPMQVNQPMQTVQNQTASPYQQANQQQAASPQLVIHQSAAPLNPTQQIVLPQRTRDFRVCACPSCGANLSINDTNREFAFCEFCGAKIMLDDYRFTQHIIDEAQLRRVEAEQENMRFMALQSQRREILDRWDSEQLQDEEIVAKAKKAVTTCLWLCLLGIGIYGIPFVLISYYNKKNKYETKKKHRDYLRTLPIDKFFDEMESDRRMLN